MNRPHHDRVLARLRDWGAHQFSSRISASQYRKAYDLVDRFVPPDGTALDWGCGEGHFSAYLLSHGMQVVGLTLNDDTLLAAPLAKKYPSQYELVADATAVRTLPFPDAHFDLVTSIGVLEHVRETGGNEADSLREIVRVLKPGGLFLCYHFPNRYSWIEAITRHIKSKHNHIYKYSRREMNQLLTDADLSVEETQRYGFLPRLLTMKWPAAIRESAPAEMIYNAFEAGLSTVLPWFCQNHYSVARKSR